MLESNLNALFQNTYRIPGGLAKHMNTIEIAVMCELWNGILERFNSSSKFAVK